MIRKLSLLVGVCLVVTCLAAGQTQSKFKNIEARRASLDYAAALKKARDDYAARLERAQSAATRAGDLDDAVKIRDEIAALKADAGKSGPRKPNAGLPDARNKLAERLVAGRWTYGEGSGGGARGMRFNADGTVELEGRPPIEWIAVDKHEALLRYPQDGGSFDKLAFNETYMSYDAYFQGDGFKKRVWGGRLVQGK